MTEPTLFVIIPCYNAEKYLPTCFRCLDGQTYKNIRAVFVDDGSSDGTNGLLNEYCASHGKNILISGENAGVSSARNKGLAAVSEGLFAFMDADDIVSDDHFRLLVKTMTEYGADMAVCGIERISDKKASNYRPKVKEPNPKVRLYDGKDGLEQFFSQEKFDFLLMNKIFSAEILKKSGAGFLSGTRYGEEGYFFFRYMSACEKTAYYPAKTYVYVQRKGSLMHAAFNESRLDIYKNLALTLLTAEKDGKYPSVVPYVKVMRAGYSVGLLYFILRGKYKNSRVIAEIVKTLSADVKSLKKCPKVAFYKKAFLPLAARLAKIVFHRHLKKTGV